MTIHDHEFVVTFHIDEDTIAEQAEKSCVAQVAKRFNDKFFGWEGREKFDNLIRAEIGRIVSESRDEIIEKAVESITRRITATKAFKDRVKEL